MDSHIIGGPRSRTCDEQRQHTWDLIISPDLIDHIDHLIKKVVNKGRRGSIGNDFRLYVTGYAEFFNEVDTGCDEVTFARTANPVDDGKEHTKLTTGLRKEFNSMSTHLNQMIQKAVDRNTDKGVKFIDIQANGALEGHRFCEKGVKEPDQHNEKLFFWHYPYDDPKDKELGLLINASSTVTQGLSTADLSAKFTDGTQYTDAIFDALDQQAFADGNGGSVDVLPGWNSIGWRAKVFHPQVKLHNHIKDLVFAQYKKDTTKPDVNKCHGVNGNFWVMHRDTAVSNAKDFCKQKTQSVEYASLTSRFINRLPAVIKANHALRYNQGSVDHLRLSVTHNGNGPNSPTDAPNCNGHFINGVIDGCDGNDPVNNPHNYKFGSTLTTGDGWVFKMEPLAQQINEDTCDVSYKFLFDKIEIRGKDWPDAKLGDNGEGLKKQLEGCGELTKWGFEWTPNDVKYQWYAHGHLPIGTKSCVGNAVMSAGGSTKANCHGAGK